MSSAPATFGARTSSERPRRDLRVLIGIPGRGARAGGPALHLPMLVEDLRSGGAGLDVRAFAYGRWNEDESLPTKLLHQLVDLMRYPLVLARSAPDVVHLNTAFDRKAIVRDLCFALLTRAARRRLLLKWHGAETELLRQRGSLWRALSGILLACSHAIGVLSSDEQQALKRAGYTKPIPIVKNGLDLRRYAVRCDIRPRLGLAADALILLFIARLIPTKGLADAVQAMASVGSKSAHLVVVGDGPSRAGGEQRAEELGLCSRVHFVGAIPEDQARDYYCGSDILVLPTHHAEGFPMSIFQAVASGMCIVTTRIRAAADHLDDPENCLFVPPRDPSALAEALHRLLHDPVLRRRMGQSNRKLAERFDRRLVAEEFADLYRRIAPG